jgi:hypothetical protein
MILINDDDNNRGRSGDFEKWLPIVTLLHCTYKEKNLK